jgi:hypothetical protein
MTAAMRLAIAVFAFMVTLTACVHAPPSAQVPVTTRSPTLAPPGAVSARSAEQIVHAAYGARSATLRTVIQVEPALVSVVGVTAGGQRLFTARYDGKDVTSEQSPFVPKEISPSRVLADMQLALWPLAAVQEAARVAGDEVTEPFAGVRRLRHGDRLVAEVHYASVDPWNGRLWFVNFEFGYSLTIDTTPAN